MANKIRQKYVDANKRGVICSADDYFYDSRGNYMWDPNRLTEAHEFCKQKSERHMNMVIILQSITRPNSSILGL